MICQCTTHTFWNKPSNNIIIRLQFCDFGFGMYYSFDDTILNSYINIIFVSFCFRYVLYLLIYDSRLTFKILVDKLCFNFIHSCFYVLINLVHVNLHVSADNALCSILREERGVIVVKGKTQACHQRR